MDVLDFNEEWTTEKNPNEPPRKKLGVFHWGTVGSTGKIIDDNGKVKNEDDFYTFQELYVSAYEDLTDKFDFIYERKLDSIRDAKLKICKVK